MINPRSIQFRLILWYSGLVVAVLLVFGAFIFAQVRDGLYNDLENTLARRGRQIASDILPRISREPADAISHEIREVYSPEATGRFIRIRRSNASVLYLSGAPQGGTFDPSQVDFGDFSTPAKRIVRLASGAAMLLVAVPAQVNDESFLIEMGAPTADIEAVLARLLRTLLTGLSVVVAGVSVGGYALVRHSLRPLEQLRETAEELSFGKARRRLPVPNSGDAIESLAVTLNQMLDRLDFAYEQASRFSADASHELRTPLTIIRAELESIAQRELPASGAIRDRVGSLLEEAERLSNITDGLFTLSRFDAGEAKMRELQFDAATMVRTTVEQVKLLIDEKGLSLTLAADQPVHIAGDPDRLKQAVIDLLDNAIKYTPAGGAISITVVARDASAVIEIADTGMGIPAEALPYVFDRFYRADAARAQQLPGSGLGLSIVRAICSAHNGTVEIHSAEGKGTICTIKLPLLRPSRDTLPA
jgi:heavy metal sensor kinase